MYILPKVISDHYSVISTSLVKIKLRWKEGYNGFRYYYLLEFLITRISKSADFFFLQDDENGIIDKLSFFFFIIQSSIVNEKFLLILSELRQSNFNCYFHTKLTSYTDRSIDATFWNSSVTKFQSGKHSLA